MLLSVNTAAITGLVQCSLICVPHTVNSVMHSVTHTAWCDQLSFVSNL